MIYAVASEVPSDCNYITAGRRYEVIKALNGESVFNFLDDKNNLRTSLWKGSAHINHGNWHRIETDENGWAYWGPKYDGDAPPDWQEGWEWDMLPYYDEPEASIPPWWDAVGNNYRYRPNQEEKTMDIDHPNTDDYRNRAERAEAECEELKERIRKLEALVCDALLEAEG